MKEIKKINIQSSAKRQHNTYERLNYKSWYAIAEFVDNSSQSYFDHVDEFEDIDHVSIDVQYDKDNTVLIIRDNAFGMDLDELGIALNAGNEHRNKSGRNEFGMGMKTAAGWFGKKWSISTTKYGSGKKYTAVVDIDNMDNDVSVYYEDVPTSVHGTEIRIEKITKKLNAPKTVTKIKDVLSSMYRRDINSGRVVLRYNDQILMFEGYSILKSFRGKDWRKDVDFTFEFDGQQYNVTGFVAIMNPGSFVKSGFALFRRDRVIIGGSEMNYKPSEIFGQQQSQRSLKLFGELNMDDFPVNQAKDGFVWDDGLEDVFIQNLKENIQDYIDIADLSIKDREKEEKYTEETMQRVEEAVRKGIENITDVTNDDSTTEVSDSFDSGLESSSGDPGSETEDGEDGKDDVIEEFLQDLQDRTETDDEKVVGKTRHYDVKLNDVRTLSLDVDWSINHAKYWIDVQQIDQDYLQLKINIDHPFFKPYSNQEEFKVVLEKFVISFVVAEVMAKMTSDREGYIYYKSIRDKMNEYLKKMGEN